MDPGEQVRATDGLTKETTIAGLSGPVCGLAGAGSALIDALPDRVGDLEGQGAGADPRGLCAGWKADAVAGPEAEPGGEVLGADV